MMKFIYVFIYIVLSLNFANAQETWYYTDSNNLQSLTKSPADQSVPVLLGGKSLRIVKLSKSITKLKSVESSLANISVLPLGIISDYRQRRRLDLVLKSNMPNEENYFLIVFNGIVRGKETIKLIFENRGRDYIVEKQIAVGGSTHLLDLNVWAYLDYNKLLKGLNSQVIDDLKSKNVNTIVIPPGYLPDIKSPKSTTRLREYLNNLNHSFDHYLLYFGYEGKKQVLDGKWKNDFYLYYKEIRDCFKAYGIHESKIILYPYDEPKKHDHFRFKSFVKAIRSMNLSMKIFVTINSITNSELSSYADIVQVYSKDIKVINSVLENKSNSTEVWLYEIHSGSINIEPWIYRNINLKAYLYDSNGVGLWNYCDVRNIYNEFDFNKYGSWENQLNFTMNNTLVYRKFNTLYTSLRWEVFSASSQEYSFMKLLESKKGKIFTKKYCEKLLSKKISSAEWENMKIEIL